MRKQCDFSISFDGEIEEIIMSKNFHFSKRIIQKILSDLIEDGTLFIGERCEGVVKYQQSDDRILVESTSCVSVGQDWNSDVWEKNEVIQYPYDRLRV